MSNTSEAQLADRLIPRRKAFRELGISVATGLRLEKLDPSFPQPVAVIGRGGGTRGFFRKSELDAWVASRARWSATEAMKARNSKNVANTAHVKAARARAAEAA